MQFAHRIPNRDHAASLSIYAGITVSVLCVSIFCLLSFSWLPNSYHRMVAWPFCLWWQLAFVLAAAVSICICRQFTKPLSSLGWGVDKGLCVIVTSAAVSALLSQFKAVAAQSVLLLTSCCIVLYLLVHFFRRKRQSYRWLWLALVTSGAITNVISIALWRPTLAMWTSDNFYEALRNPMPLGHHNFVGGYTLLMLPLTIGYSCTLTGWRRWIGGGAIALSVLTLYASGSRGALLSAIATFLFCAVVTLYRRRPQKHWQWVATILCVILLTGTFFSNPRIRNNLTVSSSPSSAFPSIEQISDSPVKDRLYMLQAGINIIKANPLFGIGPGNLSRHYTRYRPASAGEGLDVVQQLHNTPIQLTAELGLLGIGSMIFLLSQLGRIGFQIHKRSLSPIDRTLLWSIGISFFAYGLCSLTDYQLENIGISFTLLCMTALLLKLANDYLPEKKAVSWQRPRRRWISLLLLAYTGCAIQSWFTLDVGYYLASQGMRSQQSGNFADAYQQWIKAAQVIPWDPTYSALASEQLAVLTGIVDSESQSILHSEAISQAEKALKAAPNDPWFAQNLAVLSLSQNPSEAQRLFSHTLSLIPRSRYYSYYGLSQSLLSQGKSDAAQQALILEAIANPQILFSPIWQQADLEPLLPRVVEQVLEEWQSLQSNTAPDTVQFNWIESQAAFINWWFNVQSPTDIGPDTTLSPVLQAILNSDSAKDQSLDELNGVLDNRETSDHMNAIALLRAWLSPDQYLPPLLESIDATTEEKNAIAQDIQTHRNLRDWLIHIQQPAPNSIRHGLSFAYRNYFANAIRAVSLPLSPIDHPLISQLHLISRPPREFHLLDNRIIQLRDNLLLQKSAN